MKSVFLLTIDDDEFPLFVFDEMGAAYTYMEKMYPNLEYKLNIVTYINGTTEEVKEMPAYYVFVTNGDDVTFYEIMDYHDEDGDVPIDVIRVKDHYMIWVAAKNLEQAEQIARAKLQNILTT